MTVHKATIVLILMAHSLALADSDSVGSSRLNLIANVCSILFSLKDFLKNGFFSRKLMFACGQSEEN